MQSRKIHDQKLLPKMSLSKLLIVVFRNSVVDFFNVCIGNMRKNLHIFLRAVSIKGVGGLPLNFGSPVENFGCRQKSGVFFFKFSAIKLLEFLYLCRLFTFRKEPQNVCAEDKIKK